jgi:hypothetical protein
MDCLSEVVFALHDVGQAFMRDVEEIDEGLHVAAFEQVGTDGLSGVVFMVVGGRDVGGGLVLAQLIGADRIILLSHTVEEGWRTECFGWLLYGFYFFLFFFCLCQEDGTASRRSLFIIQNLSIISYNKLYQFYPRIYKASFPILPPSSVCMPSSIKLQ